MKRTGKGHEDDPHQLNIDWNAHGGKAVAEAQPPINAVIQPGRTLPPAASTSVRESDLLQRLPWDFVTTFPQPTDEALDAGTIFEEEATPERIRGLHEDHARLALGVLHDLDKVADARRCGTDPKTGKPPRTHAGREKIRGLLEVVHGRLERSWINLTAVYEEVFGPEAADAFEKALRARHAGIPVVAEAPVATRSAVGEPPNPLSWMSSVSKESAAGREEAKVLFPVRRPHRQRRLIARLPVPKPLPQAIAAGHFGQDVDGPVRPSPQEVREVTENHAERLTNLLAEQGQAERTGNETQRVRLSIDVQAAVMKYAEDFGVPAAEQLLAYARRQSGAE